MKIKKENVKNIKESYHVVNGWSKTYRNPRNSFIWGFDENYIQGDFEQINDKEYIYSTGNVSYLVKTI